MMRKLLPFLIVLALAGAAGAAENIKGLTQDENIVYVKDDAGFGYEFMLLSPSDNGTTIDAGSGLMFYNCDSSYEVDLLEVPVGKTMVITRTANGTTNCTMDLPSGMTYDGTNTRATFDAQYETLYFIGVATDRVVILENIGSVGLSAP